jgi:hypothetical protein
VVPLLFALHIKFLQALRASQPAPSTAGPLLASTTPRPAAASPASRAR